MSKKADRKLSLRKETLRNLASDQLRGAAGGLVPRTGVCGSYNCANTGTCTQTLTCATGNCATGACATLNC